MPEERRRRVEETVKTIELEGAQKVLHSLLGNPNDWSLEQLRKLLVRTWIMVLLRPPLYF